nr:hypothetical protein [Tanacetum cinerariifolium]
MAPLSGREPLDVEIFFEPDLGVLTTNVVKGIFEHYVLMPNILPTLPTFDPLYPVYDTFLLFSSENEDKVFKLTLPTSLIPIEDSDSLREEIDIFTDTDDFMPSGIESDDYDSEGDNHFLEELLSNDSISLL